MSETAIEWDAEASAKLEKAPIFVRKMIKGKVEKAAAAMGETTITAELMDKIKQAEMG
jgi:hypothetical protein